MLQFDTASTPQSKQLRDALLLVIGPPGAGRGTLCRRLARRAGARRLAVGDLLRDAVAAGSPLGRVAARFMARGFLVPDRVVLNVVYQRMREIATRDGGTTDELRKAASGFVLDGLPRTLRQAEALHASFMTRPIDAVVVFDLDSGVATRGLSGRGRFDDGMRAVQRGREIYEQLIPPVISWLAQRTKVVRVDAVREPNAIQVEVVQQLEQVGLSCTPPR
jgi:adenylate kinase